MIPLKTTFFHLMDSGPHSILTYCLLVARWPLYLHLPIILPSIVRKAKAFPEPRLNHSRRLLLSHWPGPCLLTIHSCQDTWKVSISLFRFNSIWGRKEGRWECDWPSGICHSSFCLSQHHLKNILHCAEGFINPHLVFRAHEQQSSFPRLIPFYSHKTCTALRASIFS